jgi:hypothetical protein
MRQITKERRLIKVELVCSDCKEGKHGCGRLWRGSGLEIRCCCRCIDWRNGKVAPAVEKIPNWKRRC